MLDIFDILGPVMVGPSSSHTAGAVRIGSMARTLLGDEPVEARIHLHGSFAETGPGHGTDRALVAGLLGMKPDDLRIPFAFQEAKKRGLIYTIDTVELRDAHPNTAVIETWDAGGKKLELQACSVGGGRILVNKVDGIDVSFDGPFDLSAALGRPGDFANPEHVAAISRVQRACQEAGKASFIYSPTVEDAKNSIRQGFDSVTYSMDALLLIDAVKHAVAQLGDLD